MLMQKASRWQEMLFGQALQQAPTAGDDWLECRWHVNSALHTHSKKIVLMRAQFWFRNSKVHSQVLERISKSPFLTRRNLQSVMSKALEGYK